MRTLKIMGVIGIILASFSLLCLCAFNNDLQYISGIGWGMYAALYLLSLAIVAVVQAGRMKKKLG